MGHLLAQFHYFPHCTCMPWLCCCCCSRCCVVAVDVDARRPGEPADPPHLTDRLLNNKHQDKDPAANYDVQIGDGMDIVIVGENGKGASQIFVLPNIYSNIFGEDVILPNYTSFFTYFFYLALDLEINIGL